MDRLALFDVDRTLVNGEKGHKTAFSEAFNKVYGIDTSIDIINYHGMTDQHIIIEVLKKKGLDKQSIKSKLKECMNVMVDSFNKVTNSDKIVVLNGVRDFIRGITQT